MLSLGIVSAKASLPHGDLRKENMERKIELCPAVLAAVAPLPSQLWSQGRGERPFTLRDSVTSAADHVKCSVLIKGADGWSGDCI